MGHERYLTPAKKDYMVFSSLRTNLRLGSQLLGRQKGVPRPGQDPDDDEIWSWGIADEEVDLWPRCHWRKRGEQAASR